MAVSMSNVLPRLLTVLVLLFVATHYQSFAQLPDCPTGEALLSASDPVYADVNELAQTLRNSGFVVRCVFPTHLGSIFRVVEGGVERSTIEGEANFHTNSGDVDVVFLPKPQTFSDFTITEHREDGGFIYTFAGTPRVWAVNRFEGDRRWYFLKRDNQLLLVSNDKLRSRLEHALHLPMRTP
jgi:hypothetical protein